MGLFGKSKRKSKPSASTSEPPARDPPPLPPPPPQAEPNSSYGREGGGYLNNYYSNYNEYYNNNPQPWPFGPGFHYGGPPPGQHVPPPQDYNSFPISEQHRQYYQPEPSWTPGPPEPPAPPPPAPTYLIAPPGLTMDEDPNAQCMIM